MQKAIKSVRYYSCGYCENNLGLVLKEMRGQKRIFPAGVFMIRHDKYGLILFDTGYSAEICKTGMKGRVYNLVNPTTVKKSDEIAAQLRKDGVSCDDIKMIILSHLHPDHIGGLKSFPKATIVVSERLMRKYKKAGLRDLVMRKFLPEDFEQRAEMICEKQMKTNVYGVISGYDYFGDGSLILVELDGHADGQLGALINHKTLLAADACWGNDLLKKSEQMKFPASMIQNNMDKYRKSLKVLSKLKTEGVELMFSHDTYKRRELL